MKQIGAYSILITMVLGYLGWAGLNIVSAVERISSLEVKRATQKELILRVDRKVDAQNAKFIRINNKLDKIIFEIKKD